VRKVDEVKRAIEILERIINDRTVPKNIRGAVETAKNYLNDESLNLNLRLSNAIQTLDEVTNDPNMPLYTRTQIWNAVSLLEEKRREVI